MEKRVVNINFTCEGFAFDATVDCTNSLKDSLIENYAPEETTEYRTNMELYCFDAPYWGHRFIHYEGEEGVVVNDKSPDELGLLHTVCNMDEIMEAARKWIHEEYSKQDKEFEDKDWFNACCLKCKHRRPILQGKACMCHILYNNKNAETNCGLVSKWLETRI